MFDAFKQACAHGGIMKNSPSFRREPKKSPRCLKRLPVGESGGGAVRARADGRGRLVEVVVAPALASATQRLAPW